MNSKIRLESKYLLSKNTLRLFLISLLSMSLRWGNLALNLTGLYFLLNSDFLKNLLSDYNNALVYTGVVILYSIISEHDLSRRRLQVFQLLQRRFC